MGMNIVETSDGYSMYNNSPILYRVCVCKSFTKFIINCFSLLENLRIL